MSFSDQPQRRHRPFVPENVTMKEFTWRALALGLVMTAVLGAANAYLGLRAGQTIAATYPAAVIGMAVLRMRRGPILEENIARTAGSIGESVAAGAVFTLPAFFLAHAWTPPVIPKDLGFWGRIWAPRLLLPGGAPGLEQAEAGRRRHPAGDRDGWGVHGGGAHG